MWDVLGLFGAGRRATEAALRAPGSGHPVQVWDNARWGYVTVYEPYSSEEIRAIVNSTPLGHSDMLGGYRFDYNKEDESHLSRPYYPWGINNHFQAEEEARADLEDALKNCDGPAFQRAAHRFQDPPAHYENGYTGHWWGFNPVSMALSLAGVRNTGIGHFGSVLPWNHQPDLDKENKFDDAYKRMEPYYQRWKDKCEKCKIRK